MTAASDSSLLPPSVKSVLDRSLLAPIRAMRAVYVPLLMIYFAYGFGGVTGIAQSFYEREQLTFTPAQLADLAVWVMVPWTIKMVFAQFVDGVALFGSRRRGYVFLGAAMVTVGYVLLGGSAAGWFGRSHGAYNTYYALARIVMMCGLVLQDVVADTMSTEVVPRRNADGSPRPEADVESDLGMVQVLGRLALSFGILLASFLGGQLAAHLTRSQVFFCGLAVPVISVLGAIFVKVEAEDESPVDWEIMLGGFLFGAFTIGMGIAKRYTERFPIFEYSAEIVFTVSLVVVLTLLFRTVKDVERTSVTKLALAALVIFAFRATPSVGAAAGWWQQKELGFDEAFLGNLATISSMLAIVGMWFGSNAVTKRPVTHVLAALTILGFVLYLPMIGMAYGMHHFTERHFGFGARTIALVDTSVGSPFEQLSMIPMLTIIAVNAPAGRRATWFALMASLMNLALNAASLGTKWLNKAFPMTNEGPFDAIGPLMILVNAIGLVVPLVVIALVGKHLRAGTEPAAPLPEGEPT